MFNISHKNKKKEQYNTSNYSDEIMFRYYTAKLQDQQYIDLLQIQWKAQLILALGYLLEYTASIQGINILYSRIAKRDEEFQAGEYDDREEADLQDEVKEEFKNAGIDADATALLAAQLELFGQTIITNIDWIKYNMISQNINTQDFLITKTANKEIFIGAVLEEIAYIFNLIGVNILYQLSNSDNAVNNSDGEDIE